MSEFPVLDPRSSRAGSDDSHRTMVIGVRIPKHRDGRRRHSKRHRQQQRQQHQQQQETGDLLNPDAAMPKVPSFSSLANSVAKKSAPSNPDADPSTRVHFLLGTVEEAMGDELHPIFCQMNELDTKSANPEWRETARWIKFEEDVEEGGERWSKPHVATLSLLSLFELRNSIGAGEVILECEATTIETIAEVIVERLLVKQKLKTENKNELKELLMKKNWNLHQKRMVHSSSFIGSKFRSFADIGRKHSSKDLEKGDAGISPTHKSFTEAGGLHDGSESESSTHKFDHNFLRKVPPGAQTANILVGGSAFLDTTVAAFVRLSKPIQLPEITEVPVATRFLFLLLVPAAGAEAAKEMGRCMGTLMSDDVFHEVAYLAKSKEDILAGFDEFLKYCVVLPPNEWDPSIRIEPPKEVPSQEPRRMAAPASTPNVGSGGDPPHGEKAVSAPKPTSPEAPADADDEFDASLERTGRLFGGLVSDVKRKAPFFLSDFKDAIHVQTIGAFFFIYFACLTPIITFGGLLTDATEGYLGAMESILSGAICGVIFSLFSGQPLTILGSTGPVLVFETIVYKMAKEWQWDYLGLRMWIGLWICVILLLFVAFDLSALVKYITRFTEESFAALIALIFIVEAVKKQMSILTFFPVSKSWEPKTETDLNCSCQLKATVNETERRPLQPSLRHVVPSFPMQSEPNGSVVHLLNLSALEYFDWDSVKNWKFCTDYQGEWNGSGCGSFAIPDVFFFSCLLFIATFTIGYGLKAMRNSRFFPNRIRSIISDFAIMIAIVSMTCVDLVVGLHTPKLQVPEEFSPTLGYETRGWLVSPFGPRGQNPWYSPLFAVLPALLATILIFMDQQITAVIVNRKENKLKKGLGYHLDLLIVALLIGINSVIGIPWFVAATVLSINHVMALKIESESAAPGERPKFLGCRENRLTGTLIFLLIGLSVFLTPILKHIPMPVLYGVFLYMGISSLKGMQLVQRIGLFFMPQKYQPDYKFLRHVKIFQVHKFTLIQVACLALLWFVKAMKQISILFPIMVLAMCFVRKALDFLFEQQELRWLDVEMQPFTLKPRCSKSKELELEQAKSDEKTSTEEAQILLEMQDRPDIVVESPSGRNSPVVFR